MADFEHLLHNYETVSRSARDATDPATRKQLEDIRDDLKRQLQSASAANPEAGDVVEPPANAEPVKPGAGFIEPLPGVSQQPGAPTISAPTPSSGLSDEQREGIRKFAPGGVLPPSFESKSAPVGVTQPASAPTEQPAVAQPPVGVSFEDFYNASKRGGGGTGLKVAARAAAGARGEASAATAAEHAAITARADQQALNANMEGATVAGFIDHMRQVNDDYNARSDAARKQANRALEDSKAATAEFKVAMADKGLSGLVSGGNIGAAISLALGAFGAGLQGQSGNPALTVLMARVNADLNERQHRAQMAGAHADMLDRLYRRNLDALGDIDAAKNATRAGLLEEMKAEIARQSTIAGGEDKQAAAKQVNASLDAEIARSREAAANQALLAATKHAGAGRKSAAELYKEWVQVQHGELENQKLAKELSPQANGQPDLGSVEGQRAANRKEKIQQAVAPFDTTLEYGNLLMSKGVPSVTTRAKAAAGIPLTATENEQMSALATMTRNMLKAIEQGRLSDQDAEAAKKELVRQGPTVSQEALTRQIQNLMAIAKRSRVNIIAADPEAAAVYEADKRRLGGSGAGPSDFTPAGATQVGG